MKNWVRIFSLWLPSWFECVGMQWIQWVYAVWQIFRCNPILILLLSWPLYLWHRLVIKRKIVVLDDTYDIYMYHWPEVDLNGLEKLEIISKHGKFCMARYKNNYYVADVSNVKKFGACLRHLDEGNIIFVERPMRITSSLFVAKSISEKEAAQKIFSTGGSLFPCPIWMNVVPTFIDYVELRSKLWGVLSSIPILLQARSYNRLSALVSLLIILLDINRGWLYELYDSLFGRFTKFVKLNLFKGRTNLYVFFSIFNSRWGYRDIYAGRAYLKGRGEELNVRYAELESQKDLQIVGEGKCDESFDRPVDSSRLLLTLNLGNNYNDSRRKNYYVEIVKDRAHWKRRPDIEYARANTGRPFYVL